MAKYMKKPIVVEAEVYKEGMEDGFYCYNIGGKFIGYYDKDEALPRVNCIPVIKNPNGDMRISKGDYIITELNGERHPCSTDVFEATYEKVEEEEIAELICVGDYVYITSDEEQYTAFSDFMSQFESYKNFFIKGGFVDTSKKYKVVGISEHPDRDVDDTLYLVQNPQTLQVFIMSVLGLKLVKK